MRSERQKETQKKYYQKNKEKIRLLRREYFKDYNLKNKDIINKYTREYRKQRRIDDPLYKLKIYTSNLIRLSIKKMGFKKSYTSEKILGTSYKNFKIHLEKQFKDGMNWDNQGQWHLDHIKPISLAKTEQEVYELNHYTNYQPLWAEDNLKKYNNY